MIIMVVGLKKNRCHLKFILTSGHCNAENFATGLLLRAAIIQASGALLLQIR